MGAADEEEQIQGSSGGEEKILVSVRLRPLNEKEIVYEEGAKEVALSVVNGINSSIFAYGQTSSGKTYTMSGITEYTVADIYDYIDKHKEREFILKFSAMEIYNESVRDLLSMDTTPLRLLDDPETIESSACEYLGNGKSSTLAATVNFVDLAGSERASQSLSAGMRLKEGCHINRSLLTLGTVIRKLSKGRNGHVPFRDSKLTRILQSSLGGNARTAIICTISPARTHVEQSRNTLLFASCAKEVTTNAHVNVVVSDKALVKQLQRELARLESELRSTGSNSGTSDSTELLREKDLQIEKLMSEVSKLNQQLEIANSRVVNLLRVAEDDGSSTISADPDNHYPKLRVRNSFKSENSVSYSPASEDPHFLNISVRSFDASQCSAGDTSSNSDENFIQLVDFEESYVQINSSPELSTCTSNLVGDGQHVKDSEELTCENPGNLCKEVQCITVDESSENRYANSRMSENSPNRYAESNFSSPNINMGTSGLTEVEKEDRENQELGSPQLKEEKELNCLHSDFIIPSPERPSPWLLEEGVSRSRSLKMIRSRSCRARLMSMPACLFEKVEKNENTPPIGFEKDFIGRNEGSQRKFSALKPAHDAKELSRNGSSTSVGSAAVDDYQIQSIETSIDWNSTASVSNSQAGMKYLIDQLEQETKSEANELRKNVKDVGLDPIQDDLESAVKWASEFKRLQREIIELWHACSVSLVHRTYFFLLFKGDPTDSFYMEVEHRKLSFLQDTFSRVTKLWLMEEV
ncbi:hypothetical protein GH714_015683 [Hevea brasiliensis]|uniref:Kinesin-like protein n=1 Tax=Hevea brasiliensis TaxID=3981 RepID=A0A6A6KTR5_HEVBR|nr:hypothetical protein GH714_015683 [Hevea brasiliensis]